MKVWVSEELKYLDLGNKRVNTRLGEIVSDLSEHPHETVPEAITSGTEKTEMVMSMNKEGDHCCH